MNGLCAYVSHVSVVCDASGCGMGTDGTDRVRAMLGVWSPSSLEDDGTCGADTLSLAAPFYLPVAGPRPVDWGGWLWHRVPGVLPNDADTAHEKRVTSCTREVCENCDGLGGQRHHRPR